ncbi:MAG: SMC family ATPase [Chloroflexi bacterium]|nr:SMC family ATPase [Chloroflexota bacterium]
MIPVKLELRNFLAYSSPEPLDFSGLHVACLVGSNGAGKSSLLDAITWAIWGKARTRRDDELIHLGESEMQVRLTFSFNDDMYRITRFRSKAGRGSSDLYLEILDDERWRNLTEPTIRGTQRKIDTILRLDYDTFINSAFLAQGRADEFTQKRPSERKDILAEILSLGTWSVYEERAKQAAKQIVTDIERTNAEIESIDAELQREAEYQRELNEKRRHLDDVSQELRAVEIAYHQLEALRREWSTQNAHLESIDRRIEDHEREVERLQTDRAKQAARLQTFEELSLQRETIEAGYSRLVHARQAEQSFSAGLLEYGSLRERIVELRQHVDAARSELESERRVLASRVTTLQEQVENAPTPEELDQVEAEIEDLAILESDLSEWQEANTRLDAEGSGLKQTNDTLFVEMNELKDQKTTLEAATEPHCPLCGQDLSPDHRQAVIDDLQQHGEAKRDTYLANKERIAAIQQERKELETAIREAQPEVKRLNPLRERRATLREQVANCREAQAQLEATAHDLAYLEETLAENHYALEQQAALSELYAQLEAIGYDESAHRSIRSEVEAYAEYERQKHELDRALEAIPELQAAVTRLDEQIHSAQQRLRAANQERAELIHKMAQLEEQLVDFETIEQRLNDLRDEEGNARYAVGAAEQKVNALDASRSRRAELVQRREGLAEEQGIYEDLRKAFGRNGVPAMIIETAIPEIESEANQILARMTDGRMNVRFETQREKVTGGIRETLDIQIADELGSRDYNTFSGGEAFRVNFAIRLALSRLLARRAGAQLRTLIIDEGFGTQDAQGRERLVQAINTVQNEFDLLLVITHIDELKDAFPARIEITKTPAGSIAEIV